MPYLLPLKYRFNHSFCFFMHDLMVKIIKDGESNRYFNHKFKINPDQIPQIENKRGEELYQWLIKNGYGNEWGMSIYKQIFVATLSDLLQFVFTALRSSEKGHLTVTFALLRKPFKDNLLILEWLLDNPNEFLSNFDSDLSYNKIDISKILKDKKLSIIQNACTKILYPMYTAENIYSFRYDKDADIGMENSWQKANHIITSQNPYRTEPGNLNFVFSSEEDKLSQWNHLYFILPILLLHTFQVVHILYYGTIVKEDIPDMEILNRLMVMQMLSYFYVVPELNLNNGYDISQFELKCYKCNNIIKLTPKILNSIHTKWYFRCKKFHKNYLFRLS